MDQVIQVFHDNFGFLLDHWKTGLFVFVGMGLVFMLLNDATQPPGPPR